MNEAKEIPKEMLDAASIAVEAILIEAPITDAWGGLKLAEWQWGDSLMIDCVGEIATQVTKAALEAAGVPAMAERVTGAEQIIASRQLELNQARERVAELEAAIATIRGTVDAHNVRLESCDRDGQELCDCLERALKSAGGE